MIDVISVDNISLRLLDDRNHKGFLKIFSNKPILKNINCDFINVDMKCTSLKDVKRLYNDLKRIKYYYGYMIYVSGHIVGYLDGIIENSKAYLRMNILPNSITHNLLSTIFEALYNNLFTALNVELVYLRYHKIFGDVIKKYPFILVREKLFGREDYFVLKRDLVKRLFAIDDLYTAEYAESKKVACGTLYEDSLNPLKYATTYLSLNKHYTKDDIKWYYDDAIKNKRGFVQYNVMGPIKDSMFSFIDGYEDERCLYYVSDSKVLDNIHIKASDYRVEEITPRLADDFLRVIYVESKRFGEGYAKANAKRLYDVILNPECRIKYYFIYKDNIPFGYISAYLDGDILKLEDFIISKNFRGKGYGMALLKEAALKHKSKLIYVVTLAEDDAKDIYNHMGFKCVGECHMVRKIF
ncbi:MAG: GNAT family N-acetyltransferase [Acholeplasmatales bacterium]|nr:GNAT family N-acetyltransferase [Acholeplasmatales bacterium]